MYRNNEKSFNYYTNNNIDIYLIMITVKNMNPHYRKINAGKIVYIHSSMKICSYLRNHLYYRLSLHFSTFNPKKKQILIFPA